MYAPTSPNEINPRPRGSPGIESANTAATRTTVNAQPCQVTGAQPHPKPVFGPNHGMPNFIATSWQKAVLFQEKGPKSFYHLSARRTVTIAYRNNREWR